MVDRLAEVLAKCSELVKGLKPRQVHRDTKWVQEDIDLFDALSRRMNAGQTIRSDRRRVRERLAQGSHTADEWLALTIQYKGRCAYCHRPKPLTRDHVIPLSKGGSDDISNIVPACRSCNSSKRDRILDAI